MDIVERLRFWLGTSMAGTPLNIPNDDPLYLEAADEIERLRKACGEWSEASQRNFQRAKVAEAERDRMRAALNQIDALDPEEAIYGCSHDATRGFVIRMGQIARAALAQEPS